MRLYEIDDSHEIITPYESGSSDRTEKMLIERDCSQLWLKESEGKLVYRGVRSPPGVFSVMTTRDDRKPRDTPSELHNTIVHVFNNLGFSANRNNSIFVKGKTHGLKDYGDVICNVFPIGDFSYTWSNVIDDLYEYFDSYATNDSNIDWVKKGIFKPKSITKYKNLMRNRKIKFMSYYNPNFGEMFNGSLSNEFDFDSDMFERFIDANYIDSKDLSYAIDSGHEIFVRCDKYYLKTMEY